MNFNLNTFSLFKLIEIIKKLFWFIKAFYEVIGEDNIFIRGAIFIVNSNHDTIDFKVLFYIKDLQSFLIRNL